MSAYAGLLRPLLFSIDPERAHGLAIKALARGLVPRPPAVDDRRLARTLIGLDFPNPVGLAAGFDKDGRVPEPLLRLGFGFVEIGTVTPLPQPGNPKPRLFRLAADRAIINRFGFNSLGQEAVAARLKTRAEWAGIVGVNLGANKDSVDRITDYEIGIQAFVGLADYLVVNISSPNTPGLRNLQSRAGLRDLLDRTASARDEADERAGRRTPLLVKIAPDLTVAELTDVAVEVADSGIDGVILTNTTVSRPRSLADARRAAEDGGLSGAPLFRLSTIRLAQFRQRVGPDIPLIGVGGVDSVETAWDKLQAGADLLQLYTGMIFRGPGLAAEINAGLSARMASEGIGSLAEIVGRETETWAERAR